MSCDIHVSVRAGLPTIDEYILSSFKVSSATQTGHLRSTTMTSVTRQDEVNGTHVLGAANSYLIGLQAYSRGGKSRLVMET